MLQPSTLCVPACRLPEVPTWYTVHGALKLVLEFYNGLVRQFFTLASAHRRLRRRESAEREPRDSRERAEANCESTVRTKRRKEEEEEPSQTFAGALPEPSLQAGG